MSPSSILAAYIINELGKMTDPSDGDSWPLYIAHLPDGENVETNAGAIYDSGGRVDSKSMNGSISEFPGVQLQIRSHDYNTAYKKIEDIASALDDVCNAELTIDEHTYQIQSVRKGNIVQKKEGYGTKRRSVFTANFMLTIKEI